MGISSSAAPQQAEARRTIRFTFLATVAIPATCMIVLWALAAGTVVGTSLLFVTAPGHGSCLAVLCPADADAGLVAYEMAMLVKRAGPHLAARPRFPASQITVD